MLPTTDLKRQSGADLFIFKQSKKIMIRRFAVYSYQIKIKCLVFIRLIQTDIVTAHPEFLFRLFSTLDIESNEFFEIGGIGSVLQGGRRNARQEFFIHYYIKIVIYMLYKKINRAFLQFQNYYI